MTAHTPGPWHQAGIANRDPHFMREVRAEDGSSTAWCGRYPAEEAWANARLISAAPELLEACLAARALTPDGTHTAGVLDAAIARAIGAA